MTRNDPATPDSREALKKEIKEELRQEAARKRFAKYGTCLVLLLVAILAPTIYVASVAAKTGLVEVPLLTDWLFEPSAPVRGIAPLVGSSGQDVMTAVAAGAEYKPLLDAVEIEITEKQLTTVVAEAVERTAATGALPVEVRAPQVAIVPAGMEFFVRIPREKRESTARLRFGVTVTGGQMTLEAKELRIGAVDVPKFVAGFLLGTLGQTVTDAVEDGLGDLGSVTDVDLEEAKMIVTIKRTQ